MDKKICMLLRVSSGGGAERVALRLSEKLVEYGNTVSYVYYYDNGQYKTNPKIKKHCLCNVLETKKIKRTILELKKTRYFFTHNKFDTIVIWGYSPSIEYEIAMFGIKNARVIMSERNDPNRNVKNIMINTLRNWAYSRADKIVFQTIDAKMFFSNRIQKKGCVIINPVESKSLERFDGVRDKRIITAGRLDLQKNIPLLLEAFAKFKKNHDYILLIYGTGELEKILKQMACDLHISSSVKFMGFDQNYLSKNLNCSMYVSSSDYEGISNSVLEAICAGIPTIATDCPIGGNKVLIRDGITGILVPINNVDALCDGMCRIADDESFSTKLSINAYESRNRFNIDEICKQWLKVL